MAYNSEIYKEALKKLSVIREKNISDTDRRKEEVITKIPEYVELKKQVAVLMDSFIKNLGNPDFSIATLKEEISLKMKEQKDLLIAHGYPADYIDDRFSCSLCEDKGYVGSARCSCFEKILRETAAAKSNMNSFLSEDNFSNFSYRVFSNEKNEDGISPRENMKKIISKVKKFVDNFSNPSQKSLLFIGKSGVGKTFLASCIADKILDEGYDVLYQSSSSITEMCEAYRFKRNVSDTIVSDIERLYETDLLIIDDLGCEFSNSYTVSILYDIINKRIVTRKKTLITTNYSLKELNDVYTERLFSRFLGEFDVYEFIGEDIRIKNNL